MLRTPFQSQIFSLANEGAGKVRNAFGRFSFAGLNYSSWYLEVIKDPTCPIVAHAEKKVVLRHQYQLRDSQAMQMGPSSGKRHLVICQPAAGTSDESLEVHPSTAPP